MDPFDCPGFCEIFMTNPSTRLKPVVFSVDRIGMEGKSADVLPSGPFLEDED